jgi:hypothetical protein
MLALFWILLVLGLGLPVSALAIFLHRAHQERTRMAEDLETLRSLYSGMDGREGEEQKALRDQANQILEKYELRDMLASDFNVLPLWAMRAASRAAVPEAWLELIMVGVGLASSAAASVVALYVEV